MKNIDLEKYNIRTDLIDDVVKSKNYYNKIIKSKDVVVNRVYIDKDKSKFIKKDIGNYSTISFNDITDSTNYEKVLNIFIKELNYIFKRNNIGNSSSFLVLGLGNSDITPDSLGVKVSKKVIVTKHIKDLTGSLEEGYRVSSSFSPSVMGKTGIETSLVLQNIVKIVKPDVLLVIDSLAASDINRLSKCIQITDSKIGPGSGVGNNRKEISSETIGCKIIAIGVPLVVNANVIALSLLKKDMKKNKKLNNLVVTSVDIDFLVDKLSDLIASGINFYIHYKK